VVVFLAFPACGFLKACSAGWMLPPVLQAKEEISLRALV
jgi:hypothetical protein